MSIIEDDIYNHIADLIEDGYTSGDLFGEEPSYKGWWSINIKDDGEDQDTRNEEIARLIRDGYTSGYYHTFSLSINIWSE
jgi:hypothetical protein